MSPEQHPTRRVRAAPRYLRFLATGAAVGFLAAVIVTLVRGRVVERPELLFFYLSIVLTGLGTLLGGLVAVLIEGWQRR